MSAEAARPSPLGIVLPFTIVTLIWGSTWLVIRDQVSAVPPGWSVTYRFTIATLAMFALVVIRRQPLWIGSRMLGMAGLIGLTQFVGNFNFVYRAEQYLTSGIVAVFFALLLIPNSLLAWALFRQPVSRGFIAGSLMAMAGVLLLLLHEYRAASIDPAHVLTGILLCFAGLSSVSIANVAQASERARNVPILTLLAWSMLVGTIVDAVLAWFGSGPPVFDPRPAYIGGIFYLGIFGSVVTFPLYFGLIRDMGPGPAAYNGVIVPVIAMLLSTLFEGYHWSALAVAGSFLAVIGMIIALRARQRPTN